MGNATGQIPSMDLSYGSRFVLPKAYGYEAFSKSNASSVWRNLLIKTKSAYTPVKKSFPGGSAINSV
ncbi:MAG: hypothetical protein OHK0035_18280 [Cyanobacteria bacterium J069]